MMKGPLFILATVTLLVSSHLYGCKEGTAGETHVTQPSVPREIRFHKQGEVTFVDKNGRKIVTIDIEIPKTEKEVTTGLMFRKQMAEREGMLFGHEKMPIRYYWMKNTYIPLDMIFVDKTLEVIGIRKTATPLSEELIPVPPDARYTIEVNGGFCDRHGIRVGNKIVR